MVPYLDDVTVFSNKREDHLQHLKQNFDRSRKYKISLNLKKNIFAVTEQKLLGFVISKHGSIIDPERTKMITQIYFPHNKKAMQSFLNKINFVWRFVSDFVEIVKSLQNIIKKGAIFK